MFPWSQLAASQREVPQWWCGVNENVGEHTLNGARPPTGTHVMCGYPSVCTCVVMASLLFLDRKLLEDSCHVCSWDLFLASLQCVLAMNEQVWVGQQEEEKERREFSSVQFSPWRHEVERSVHLGGEDQGENLAQQGVATFYCSLHYWMAGPSADTVLWFPTSELSVGGRLNLGTLYSFALSCSLDTYWVSAKEQE